MNPVSLILSAASLAGAIFGGQRKQIDPKWLEANFGPAAVSKEAMEMFHSVLNSPYGQSIMANAAEQGQAFQRNTNRQAAEAGLAGPNGTSGAGIFATSAAGGATDALQREASSGFYQSVLPVAQQMVQSRMAAYLNGLQNGGYETNASRTWSNIGQAAGTVGAMLPEKSTTQPSNNNTSTISGPDNAPAPNGGEVQQANASSLTPARTATLANASPLLPTFSKLRRFGTRGAVQTGGAYA